MTRPGPSSRSERQPQHDIVRRVRRRVRAQPTPAAAFDEEVRERTGHGEDVLFASESAPPREDRAG